MQKASYSIALRTLYIFSPRLEALLSLNSNRTRQFYIWLHTIKQISVLNITLIFFIKFQLSISYLLSRIQVPICCSFDLHNYSHSFNLEICNTHRSASLQNRDENSRPDLIKQNKKQTWSENRTFDQNFKLA